MNKFFKSILIFFLIIGTFSIIPSVILTRVIGINKKYQEEYDEKFNDYLAKVFNFKKLEKILEERKQKKENFIIFIGGATCPYCVVLKERFMFNSITTSLNNKHVKNEIIKFNNLKEKEFENLINKPFGINRDDFKKSFIFNDKKVNISTMVKKDSLILKKIYEFTNHIKKKETYFMEKYLLLNFYVNEFKYKDKEFKREFRETKEWKEFWKKFNKKFNFTSEKEKNSRIIIPYLIFFEYDEKNKEFKVTFRNNLSFYSLERKASTLIK